MQWHTFRKLGLHTLLLVLFLGFAGAGAACIVRTAPGHRHGHVHRSPRNHPPGHHKKHKKHHKHKKYKKHRGHR